MNIDPETAKRMYNMARIAGRLHIGLEHREPKDLGEDSLLAYLGRVIEAEANKLGVFGVYRPQREEGS